MSGGGDASVPAGSGGHARLDQRARGTLAGSLFFVVVSDRSRGTEDYDAATPTAPMVRRGSRGAWCFSCGGDDGNTPTDPGPDPPGPNEPPVAQFVADVQDGEAPLLVSFDASASSDPDGTIASYAWDFGGRRSGTGRGGDPFLRTGRKVPVSS